MAAGCSDDDAADTTTTEAAHDAGDHGAEEPGGASDGPAPLEGEPMSADACGHFGALSASMGGDPTIAGPALEMFVDTLPAELREHGATVVDGLGAAFEGDPSAMSDPEFVASFEAVGDAMWAGCEAASRLDVTGVDFGFDGLPETVPAGMMALRFTNGTSADEAHELLVLQRPPGDTTPIDEIAEMSPDEIMTDYSMVGLAFAETPEAASTSFIDLPTGSYVLVCTIPVGGGETGDPHSQHGMIAALEAV